MLNDLLVDFPFADNASRSVGISMLMTPVLRGALAPAVPMHAVTAPESGTGKSYLADLASAISTGDHWDRPRRLASFERWSDLVCGALRWLKWEDPVNTMSVIRADDPTRQHLAAVLEAWPGEPSEYSTAELIQAALECDPRTGPLRPAWLAALNTIARKRQGNLDPTIQGIWLRDHRDRMAGNLKLVRTGTATRPRWGVAR